MNSDHYTVNNQGGLLQQNLLTHTVKKISINTQINDLLALKYDETEEVPFQLYNENPKKLSIWNQIINRTYIQNFIIYQYSLKAKTFVERKLLKTTKTYCCRNMVTYKLKNFTFFFLMTTFFVGHPGLKKNILIFSLMGSLLFSDSYWWLKNNRSILLNFQINSYFKLGRETKDFVCFIENQGFGMLDKNKENKAILSGGAPQKSLQSENTSDSDYGYNCSYDTENFQIRKDEARSGFYLVYDKDGKLKAEFSRHPAYYKKFFVKEIFDVKFEPEEDQYIDYLNTDLDYDFHKEYLKKLSKSPSYKKNTQDLLSLIR